MPLTVRVSATDWTPGGWDIGECVELSRWLREAGVDLIVCSSGGSVPRARVPAVPGYQVPFAARIRREAGIRTGAVGLVTEAQQADDILGRGEADLVLMAREFLRDPYFSRGAPRRSWATRWRRRSSTSGPGETSARLTQVNSPAIRRVHPSRAWNTTSRSMPLPTWT